uniref:Sorting nexin MVP1 n=1 Tax=Schizophyllum commune (strain H4-8 / FGSC 9210) TaxID=578458 RepID=D8Q1I6_SCHCM
MFNAPRSTQRYTSGGFGSFVDENPLASSVYDTIDPWSNAPSPAPPPVTHANSVFSSVIADATVPAIYNRAFNAVDLDNTGDVSVNSLSRALATSSLPASTIDRIVNLVSSRPRVSRLEFFVALALVALAQSGKGAFIEQVAALSSENSLPEPALDLDSLVPSTSTFYKPASPPIASPAPAYSSFDPWGPSPFTTGSGFDNTKPTAATSDAPALTNGASSNFTGTGLPPEWWRKLEKVQVSIVGQQGFILNRYTVYQITSSRGSPVTRRYSEFVYLWEVLTRRYPFRLFPALPPKRIGPDEYFIEQRRRGLARVLNFIVNHPVIKDDALLGVFLTEPSFEVWRKQNSVTLDEESASKRVDRVEEMAIPSDLEDKLSHVRAQVPLLIEHWQRACILAERIVKKREAAAVRTSSLRRALHIPAHLLPASSTLLPSDASMTGSYTPGMAGMSGSYAPNMSGSTTLPPLNASVLSMELGEQSDLSRLTNTLRAVVEVGAPCWRGEECELSNGVRAGLSQVAAHTQRYAEMQELRTRSLMDTTLEGLKAQRDLYIAMRDLFVRHDRLSVDQVERLKKRVETTSLKMDGIKSTRKEGWEIEADKLASQIERDQATIAAQLSRRVFIRACMWHELKVVLHNRENTLPTLLVQAFAREETEFTESVLANWNALSEAVESMPLE